MMRLPGYLKHLDLKDKYNRLRGPGLFRYGNGMRPLDHYPQAEKYLHYAIQPALRRFGPPLSPCADRTWLRSLIKDEGRILLYYNTPDKSTHLVCLKGD